MVYDLSASRVTVTQTRAAAYPRLQGYWGNQARTRGSWELGSKVPPTKNGKVGGFGSLFFGSGQILCGNSSLEIGKIVGNSSVNFIFTGKFPSKFHGSKSWRESFPTFPSGGYAHGLVRADHLRSPQPLGHIICSISAACMRRHGVCRVHCHWHIAGLISHKWDHKIKVTNSRVMHLQINWGGWDGRKTGIWCRDMSAEIDVRVTSCFADTYQSKGLRLTVA